MILLTYVNDCIIVGPSIVEINAFVQSTKKGPKRFVWTDEGYINKFLGTVITHNDEKIFKVSQPLLIESIIFLINIDMNDYGM